jgi:cytochrome c oxidase assembly factor CtaG
VSSWLSRRRSWLAIAAAVLVLVSLVPPAGTYARRYVFAESLQFVVFATVVPALLVLGAPWRLFLPSRFSRPQADAGGRATRTGRPRRGSSFRRGAAVLLAFIAAVIAWRLRVTVDALANQPGLVVAEMVTLVAAGSALWLELVESPPLLPRLPRPLRAAFAALAMWTIWILAYILGFSHVAWFPAYVHPGGLSPVNDQEIATGILWAVPALCFFPVVYATVLTWLRDSEDPDEALRAIVRAQPRGPGEPGQPGQPESGRWPRPPRGWDTHSA